ncbi:MAG: portal protein, partial [Gammaproteobacteria bacterium]|nr:portal protein [Gammaproteobacteria bacterium]
MSKTAEIKLYLDSNTDGLAQSISGLWFDWDSQRDEWKAQALEARDYIFATDTTKTTNNQLPWKNKTTTPKLTQIRDNLHSNYISALFPNDDWLRWDAFNQDSATQEKRDAIEAYMKNKTQISNFRSVASQLLLDYIDYGNCFAEVDFVHETRYDDMLERAVPVYIGPRLKRISPYDIVFDPTAMSFDEAPKITRSLVNIGDLKLMAEQDPDKMYLTDVIAQIEKHRQTMGSYMTEDLEKVQALQTDGFGNYYSYVRSNYVEILQAEGDFHDPDTGELLKNHVITIFDRMFVGQKRHIPNWMGRGYKFHAGWRLRPDNLWAMGPLDNLVGMQYRIDHLENLKSDVFDLIAFPPLKIYGEVEDFDWGPGCEIHLDEDADVQMLVPDTTALNADTQIALLEQKMEEYAGAPRQAMGVRTPGEKTKFEVQQLMNSAGRIFQEKITYFEINLLEPALNAMLEVSRRQMNVPDVVKVMDDDLAVQRFMNITRDDITGQGKIRPIGARHFSAQATMVQDLANLMNGPMAQMIAPHVSRK